jgi:uncharacterized protein
MMSLSPQEAQRQAGAAEQREKARDKSGSGLIPVIFWLMIAVFVLLSLFRRSVGRRYQRRGGGGRRYQRRRGGVDPWVVLWGLSELSQASRGGGWGGGGGGFGGFGGGGGGGFGGFSGGGGSFGGGGASGGW